MPSQCKVGRYLDWFNRLKLLVLHKNVTVIKESLKWPKHFTYEKQKKVEDPRAIPTWWNIYNHMSHYIMRKKKTCSSNIGTLVCKIKGDFSYTKFWITFKNYGYHVQPQGIILTWCQLKSDNCPYFRSMHTSYYTIVVHRCVIVHEYYCTRHTLFSTRVVFRIYLYSYF